jgi:hypothetical protein
MYIRTYNSHLSRIEVMTFADLIEGAEGSFALADADAGEASTDEWEADPWPEPEEGPLAGAVCSTGPLGRPNVLANDHWQYEGA